MAKKKKASAESTVRQIHKKIRRKHSEEDLLRSTRKLPDFFQGGVYQGSKGERRTKPSLHLQNY